MSAIIGKIYNAPTSLVNMTTGKDLSNSKYKHVVNIGGYMAVIAGLYMLNRQCDIAGAAYQKASNVDYNALGTKAMDNWKVLAGGVGGLVVIGGVIYYMKSSKKVAPKSDELKEIEKKLQEKQEELNNLEKTEENKDAIKNLNDEIKQLKEDAVNQLKEDNKKVQNKKDNVKSEKVDDSEGGDDI